MRRVFTLVGGSAAIALLLPAAAAAHGLGGITDLPVPGWLFLVGGATVLIVSFVALGALWTEPKLVGPPWVRLPAWVGAIAFSQILLLITRTLSLLGFVVVWAAAAFGSEHVVLNIAPTFIYVIFWVGVPVVTVLFGNVWRLLDPWRATADLVAFGGRLVGVEPRRRAYPEEIGVWPAVALLFAFVTLELIYEDPADPRVLAIAIAIYSAGTWLGMACFGREAWTRNGDGFALYFNLLSRIALFGVESRNHERRLVIRRPFSGLTFVDRRRGIVAFVAVMLGSVAFDGFSRSSWWQNQLFSIQDHLGGDTARAVRTVNLLVLIATMLIVAIAYTLAVRAAERAAGGEIEFDGVFLGSLIPIAFVYVLAHYLTYLLVQGQFVIPRLSDPFGKGWDIFGTVGFEPKLDVLTPNQTWYAQITVLVLGHVVGLVVAHDRAIALVPSPRLAVRTQMAMLWLMVFYTVGGMWLLSLR